MIINDFEKQLTGGHPNSLGKTEEVVAEILDNKPKPRDLMDCYKSSDEVVRLRVSSALKRITKVKPDWILEILDELLDDVSKIDQPSAKWSLAQMFMWLGDSFTQDQAAKATNILKNNLENEPDWIVQNTTMESLKYFSASDDKLMKWLKPELKKRTKSKHKSVARRAEKYLSSI